MNDLFVALVVKYCDICDWCLEMYTIRWHDGCLPIYFNHKRHHDRKTIESSHISCKNIPFRLGLAHVREEKKKNGKLSKSERVSSEDSCEHTHTTKIAQMWNSTVIIYRNGLHVKPIAVHQL